jgi:hypothetical protein
MLPYITNRGVERLVHFTRVENVASILTHGLIGRETLEFSGIEFLFNDQHRFDYQPNATCLSFSFPNYKLFYALRQKDLTVDWAVIRIGTEVIRDKRCAFSHMNAASREIAQSTIESRMRKSALEAMFSDHCGMPNRATLNIPDSYSTNPQAEVLSLDTIERHYIRDVLFDAKHRIRNVDAARALVRAHKGTTKFFYGAAYFQPRSDYVHWRAS